MNLTALMDQVEDLAPLLEGPTVTFPTATGYNEAESVARALNDMPCIKTVGTQWYEYTGGTWRRNANDHFRPLILSVLAEEYRTNKRVVEILKHIESLKQISDSELRGFYAFDADAVLLNAANGIVRVRPDYQIELVPHAAEWNFTLQIEASYDPQSRSPIFERVLVEALPDPEDRALLQLFVGSILLPSCKYEAALICYGPGGTGKSTIAEAIVSIFESALVERIGMTSLCDPRGYNLPKLKWVAVNLGTELDALEVGESGNFKVLASGERINVRAIYGTPFSMETTAKLWFLSNNLPRFKHGSDAEHRRMRFLRFDKLPAIRDVDLKQKLVAEREGILLWALEGLSRLLSLREMPQGGIESKQVHERFEVNNDPIGTFIASRCRFDSNGILPKEHFSAALKEFCEGHSIPCEDNGWLFKILWNRFPELKPAQVTQMGKRTPVIKGLVLLEQPA